MEEDDAKTASWNKKWRVSGCYYLCICILRVGSMTIGRGRSWLERRRSFLCFRSGFLHQSFPSLTLTPLGLILFLSRNKWPQAEKGGSYISCSHTWKGPSLPYRSGTCYSQFISPVFCFTEQQLSLWCPKLLFCVRIKCSIAMSSPLGFPPSSFLPYYPCAHSKNTASSSHFFKCVWNISRPLLQRFIKTQYQRIFSSNSLKGNACHLVILLLRGIWSLHTRKKTNKQKNKHTYI